MYYMLMQDNSYHILIEMHTGMSWREREREIEREREREREGGGWRGGSMHKGDNSVSVIAFPLRLHSIPFTAEKMLRSTFLHADRQFNFQVFINIFISWFTFPF